MSESISCETEQAIVNAIRNGDNWHIYMPKEIGPGMDATILNSNYATMH